jgi:hypothetical protein
MEQSNGYPHGETLAAEACLKQDVEVVSGEPARHTKLRLNRRVRSDRGGEALCLRLRMLARTRCNLGAMGASPRGVSAVAVEAYMNNGGSRLRLPRSRLHHSLKPE